MDTLPQLRKSHPDMIRLIAMLTCLGLALPLAAQTWPTRTVTVVVPFPPGAGPDLVARALGERLSVRLGQPFIVDNRPGVGGMAGSTLVARAAADGHTLAMVPNTLVIAPHVLSRAAVSIDVLKDLAPVVQVVTNAMTLAVHPGLGVNSVRELIELAKRRPGLAYATGGNGSPMHIVGELFKASAGIDLQHVAYKGVTPSINDVIGGQVQVLWVPWGGAAQFVRAGRLRALALADRRRSANAGDVPAMAELGFPEVISRGWVGLLAPAGTPVPVIARLNGEINALLQTAEIRQRMADIGFDVVGGGPEVLAGEMREDFERYGRLVRELKIEAN
ncbi:MAG: tripartite tricarboxylate transporter substrate binding protein [Burkholderiales bacterium]|nr:tripartite tricarboxylate transporter substrate binding protein [Burkholderiales bacterium]